MPKQLGVNCKAIVVPFGKYNYEHRVRADAGRNRSGVFA